MNYRAVDSIMRYTNIFNIKFILIVESNNSLTLEFIVLPHNRVPLDRPIHMSLCSQIEVPLKWFRST